MIVHQNAIGFNSEIPVVLTIGTFDGVHIGHRAVLDLLKKRAAEIGGTTVLLIFDPHPRTVLHPDIHHLQLLNTLEEKKELLMNSGLDHLVVHPFTTALSKMSPLEYVRELFAQGIKPDAVIVGYDHRFGRNREGDFESLKNLGTVFGFSVEKLPAQTIENTKVSSTKVREALIRGEVAQANRWLQEPYSLCGKVIQGAQLGRKMGFPTANIEVVHPLKLVPASGVYATFARIGSTGPWQSAMVNIGTRPTVNPSAETNRIEVHLITGGRDCYDELLSIRFIRRLRDEMTFESVGALKEQLVHDRLQALKILDGSMPSPMEQAP